MSKNAYERRIQRLEDEKKELIRKLENSNRALQKFAHGPIVDNDVAAANESNANEIRKLQDELNTMTKRNQGMFYYAENLIQPDSSLIQIRFEFDSILQLEFKQMKVIMQIKFTN